MLSLVLSTVAYFVASYFIKRYLDSMDIPRGLTRSIVVFTLALAVAYGVSAILDRVVL